LSRPIIARLHTESRLNERITPRRSHQRLLQQNLPKADIMRRSKKAPLFDNLVGEREQIAARPSWPVASLRESPQRSSLAANIKAVSKHDRRPQNRVNNLP